jgi:transcriptional regulator with XRE-family HTH domain
MRIEKYLDEVMRKNDYKRDKQLAEWLGVTPVSISNYRHGERFMDNEKCIKLALELDMDPLKIIMATDMDKAEKTGQHSLWEIFSQRMAATAASAALAIGAVTLFLTPDNAQAAQTQAPQAGQQTETLYYVKSSIRRRAGYDMPGEVKVTMPGNREVNLPISRSLS